MNVFLIFFSILVFSKIESCEFECDTSTIRKNNFDCYVHKDLTEERVSIFLDYEVHPVDIKLWID